MSFAVGNTKLTIGECRKIYAKSGVNYTDDELIKMRDWLDNLADIALAIIEQNGIDNMNEIIERANRNNDESILKINSSAVELLMKSLKTRLKSKTGYNKSELENVVKEIEKNKTRLKNAQVLMLDGELNPTEYKEMKIKLEEDMMRLTIEGNKLRSNTTSYDKVYRILP